MIRPRREFFANHCVADDDPITGQNVGSIVARMMMWRVLARRTAWCKTGS
jgi:hypothetical protein